MSNTRIKQIWLGAVAAATLIAAPALAHPVHKHTRHAGVVTQHEAAGQAFASAVRQHAPNPAWDVYSRSGKYIGSDPDPLIRGELRREWDFRD